MQARIVTVHLADRSYEIEIGSNIRGELGPRLERIARGDRAAIVTDDRVAELYLDGVSRALSFVRSGFRLKVVKVPPGEKSKSLDQVRKLYDEFSAFEMDRSSLVIALGGGVVGDLAGFAAATYLRGLDYVQVPTTLLADVDSSVGGKVAVDLPQGKNLVGAFHQPRAVFIDTWVLRSLPKRELQSGLAEVVKYAVIRDSNFFQFLEDKAEEIFACDEEVLAQAIEHCVRIKAEVVEKDEKEEGLRSILNYGHTVGHALEALSGYEGLSHGEAVAAGMIVAARISLARKMAPAEVLTRQQRLLQKFGLPAEPPKIDAEQVEALFGFMARDKKFRAGKMRFILPRRIGEVELSEEVTLDDVRKALAG